MNGKLLAALAVTMVLVACATAPKNAPMFSVGALPPASQEYAVLLVYRQIVFPLAYKPTISVNGQEAAELPNDAFTWIKVKPGHVHLRNDWSFAAGNPSGAFDLDVDAGRYYYFEIAVDPPCQDEAGMPSLYTSCNVQPIFPVAAAHAAFNLATLHVAIQGRGIYLESQAYAAQNLTKCCRYVPVEDDYVPTAYVPSDKGTNN